MMEHVLRVPRSDSKDFVLLNIKSIPTAKHDLDVQIEGTDGETPFVTELKQSQISTLLAKSSPIEPQLWEVILRSTLLQQRDGSKDAMENLELISHVTAGQLVLGFRKNISGIHQRLGEITLKRDDDHELDTITWISTAVARSDELEAEVGKLSAKYDVQSQTVKSLSLQLDDLAKAKAEHEATLLQKFSELLNAKKLKIRDQQRLLALSKIDPAKASEAHASRGEEGRERPRTVKASRSRKRKTSTTRAPASEGSNESDFESMPADRYQATPDNSDLDENAEEDDDDLDAAQASYPATVGQGNKGKAIETVKNGQGKSPSPPPRRDLPFARTGGRKMESKTGKERIPEPEQAVSSKDQSTKEASDTDEGTDDEL